MSVQTDGGFDPVWEAVASYREPLEQAGWFVVGFAIVYVVGRYVARPAVRRIIRGRNRNNPTLVQAVERYVQVLVVLVAASVGAATAGYGYVLTNSAIILAAVTLALGVAGQEVIGNLISGVFLVTDPHFNVGDWIVWDDREGTVESITLRVARVRTPNNEIVSVPNTELTTSAVVRPYGQRRYRISVDVGIDYDDDVDTALAALVEEALDQPDILDEPRPESYVVEFGEDSVDLRALFWLSSPSRRSVLAVRSTFVRRIKRRFEEEGLTINPPTQRDLTGRLSVDRSPPTDSEEP